MYARVVVIKRQVRWNGQGMAVPGSHLFRSPDHNILWERLPRLPRDQLHLLCAHFTDAC